MKSSSSSSLSTLGLPNTSLSSHSIFGIKTTSAPMQRRDLLKKKTDISKDRELFKRFKVLKFLGKGSYGSVYKVQRLSDGLIYAVKEADVSKMTQLERMDAVNEIRLLASIQHSNIICYNEAFIDGNFLCIIMEFATRGDIGGYIKKGKELKKDFPEDIVWNFFIQICLGVQVLHDNQIIHRDIKPMNIFVSDHDVIKVGDLGIAKKLKADLAHTQIGTPHYMPPEIWKNRPYSYACDIWSLGCLLYEIMTYKLPFVARSLHALRVKVTMGRFTPIPTGKYSKELISLCESMLQCSPSKRPSVESILTSPIVLKKINSVPREIPVRRRSENGDVMMTIRVPRNLKLLNARLPPANYESDAAVKILDSARSLRRRLSIG